MREQENSLFESIKYSDLNIELSTENIDTLLWREAVCREMDFTGDRDFIIVQINTQVLIREVSNKGVHTGLRIGHSCKAWGPGLQQAKDCRAHTGRGNCSAGSVVFSIPPQHE